MKNKKILYFIPVIIAILDQIVKLAIINKNIVLIPDFLSISYAENTGGAFSILNENCFILIVCTIIIITIAFKFFKSKIEELNLKEIISLLVVLGGVISNLSDRIFRGYVIDYIKVNLFDFPIFNIADICIVLGVIFIGICIIIKK